MEIINRTKRPLVLPLPGGKKLRLGPGRTGQIAPKAAQHPPVKEFIDKGEVEILDGNRTQGTGGSGGNARVNSKPSGGGGSSGVRHTGDR